MSERSDNEGGGREGEATATVGGKAQRSEQAGKSC